MALMLCSGQTKPCVSEIIEYDCHHAKRRMLPGDYRQKGTYARLRVVLGWNMKAMAGKNTPHLIRSKRTFR